MKYNSLFAFAALLLLLSACEKENTPQWSTQDLEGDWQETSRLTSFEHDSAGQIIDTIVYQATLTLAANGTYQTVGERPFGGITTSGTWVLHANEEKIVLSPASILPGFPAPNPVVWNVRLLTGTDLEVEQVFTVTPTNSAPITSTSIRTFER